MTKTTFDNVEQREVKSEMADWKTSAAHQKQNAPQKPRKGRSRTFSLHAGSQVCYLRKVGVDKSPPSKEQKGLEGRDTEKATSKAR